MSSGGRQSCRPSFLWSHRASQSASAGAIDRTAAVGRSAGPHCFSCGSARDGTHSQDDARSCDAMRGLVHILAIYGRVGAFRTREDEPGTKSACSGKSGADLPAGIVAPPRIVAAITAIATVGAVGTGRTIFIAVSSAVRGVSAAVGRICTIVAGACDRATHDSARNHRAGAPATVASISVTSVAISGAAIAQTTIAQSRSAVASAPSAAITPASVAHFHHVIIERGSHGADVGRQGRCFASGYRNHGGRDSKNCWKCSFDEPHHILHWFKSRLTGERRIPSRRRHDRAHEMFAVVTGLALI